MELSVNGRVLTPRPCRTPYPEDLNSSCLGACPRLGNQVHHKCEVLNCFSVGFEKEGGLGFRRGCELDWRLRVERFKGQQAWDFSPAVDLCVARG